MNKILDICIASFEKAETTYSLVNQILQCKSNALGVVVVDNCSSDSTVELLETINDKRLRIIENEKNIGGAGNFVKAIMSGNAVFSLYCNDRDLLFPEKLDEFIEFLNNHQGLSCGWCSRNVNKLIKGRYKIYSSKDALRSFCYRSEHPTGFFFNRGCLSEISHTLIEEFSNTNNFVPFPWECIQAECSSMGESAIYNDVIWASTGDISHKKYISSYVALDNIEDRWFSVSNTANRICYYLEQLDRLNGFIRFSNKEYLDLQSNILLSGYKICVWRYKAIRETQSLAYHYSINLSKVGKKEIDYLSSNYSSFVFKSPHIIEKKDLEAIYKKKIRQYIHYLKKSKVLSFLSKIRKVIFK